MSKTRTRGIAAGMIALSMLTGDLGVAFAVPQVMEAAPKSASGFTGTSGIQAWIFHYADKPEPARVPYAYVALSQGGALRDPEQAGMYLGFLAGVLNRAGPRADKLLVQLTALPHEDQWIIVRALAYSNLPNWQELMRRLEKHIPGRREMAEAYLAKKLPTLSEIALDTDKPSKWQDMKDWVTFHKRPPQEHRTTFANTPELIDTLWGFYFATGEEMPVAKLVTILPWAKDKESVDKLTIGAMVRYTMAENASRSQRLMTLLKAEQPKATKEQAPVLTEVVHAAETVDTGYLRKSALASIDDLKAHGPNSSRDVAWWGQVGEGAISLGCLGAAVSGVGSAIGIPCVVGGALSSAGLKMMASP